MPPLPTSSTAPCPERWRWRLVALAAALLWTLLAAILLLLWGVFATGLSPLQAAAEPLQAEPVAIIDDLDRASLITALERSRDYLRAQPPSTVRFADQTVPVQRLLASVDHLTHLLHSIDDDATLQQRLAKDFYFLSAPATASQRQALITGYYQPIFAGSLQRQPPFLHPLYALPADLVIQRQAGKPTRIGRWADEKFTPYWTRREIESGNRLRGGELVWLRDPFDAFTLHIQGSGIIRLPDGALRGVRFVQKNGHPYTSIGTVLVRSGRMQLQDVTMDSIRDFLATHPEDRESILWQNDSFIFFAWGPPGPAIGNLGLELTPGRSAAADQSIYPPGAILFVQSRRPEMVKGEVVKWREMARLVTVQDTGSALKGLGRIDLFWGTGEEAGMEAGQMKEAGRVALLLLRENRSIEP